MSQSGAEIIELIIDHAGPALRHGSLNSLFQVALYLSSRGYSHSSQPLSREYGTCKTVKARFWPELPGKSPEKKKGCSLFARPRLAPLKREFFIDNFLVQNHFIIEMICGPRSRHESLNSLSKVALYLPSYPFQDVHPARSQDRALSQSIWARKVDIRLPGKGNSHSRGARPVHLIISIVKWIRTSRLSIKNSLSSGGTPSLDF